MASKKKKNEEITKKRSILFVQDDNMLSCLFSIAC